MHIPHASKELNETAIAKSQGHNNVGMSDVSCVDIDKGENKGSQGKGGETKGCWVGELAILLVETGLESTTESLQAKLGVVCRNMREWIAAIVVWSSLCCAVCAGMVKCTGSMALLVKTCSALGTVRH